LTSQQQPRFGDLLDTGKSCPLAALGQGVAAAPAADVERGVCPALYPAAVAVAAAAALAVAVLDV